MSITVLWSDYDWRGMANERDLDMTVPEGMVWTVGDETFVHFQRVSDYVRATPLLDPWYDTIFADWPNTGEHLKWVAESSPAEVRAWAEHITSA